MFEIFTFTLHAPESIASKKWTATRFSKIGRGVSRLIIKSILHLICGKLIEHIQWKTSHYRKAIRHLLYIDGTFKVQFFLGIENCGCSLLHIVFPGNIRQFFQYLTSGYEIQLRENQSESLQVQVTSDKTPVLRKKHTSLRHWERTSTAVHNLLAGEDELANDVHHSQHVYLLRLRTFLRPGCTGISLEESLLLR